MAIEPLDAGAEVTAPGNPVLAGLAYAPGVLSYRGARYLLIRPETLAALQHAAEAALGQRAGDCFVAGGRVGGGGAVSGLAGPPRERIDGLLAMGTAIGWGAFALETLTPSSLVVTVEGSPFAAAYGDSASPVCHLTRGVLESLVAAAFGAPWTVRETACAAMGAARCRFAATPPP